MGGSVGRLVKVIFSWDPCRLALLGAKPEKVPSQREPAIMDMCFSFVLFIVGSWYILAACCSLINLQKFGEKNCI